jgi:hypothetical protein
MLSRSILQVQKNLPYVDGPLRIFDAASADYQKRPSELAAAKAHRQSPEAAVSITGETRDYARRFFCPLCGSSIFSRSGDEIEVHLGSLDAPDQLMPTYELWTVRHESWLPPFSLKGKYIESRESEDRTVG